MLSADWFVGSTTSLSDSWIVMDVPGGWSGSSSGMSDTINIVCQRALNLGAPPTTVFRLKLSLRGSCRAPEGSAAFAVIGRSAADAADVCTALDVSRGAASRLMEPPLRSRELGSVSLS